MKYHRAMCNEVYPTARRPILVVVAAILLFATPAFAQPPTSDGGVAIVEDPHAQADQLHLEAKELLKEQKWEEALVKLEEAYRLKPSFDITSNLGWTLSALDRHVEAARRFHEAEAKLPTKLEPKERAAFENTYDYSRSQVGMARVRGSTAGLTILVDGEPLGTTGEDELIFVEPGEHRFEAERDGERSAPVVRTLEAGKEQVIELGPVQANLVEPPPQDGGAAAAPVAFGVVLGVGVASAIAGGALFGVSGSFGSDAASLREEIVARSGPTPCPGGDPSCPQLRELLEDKDTFFNAGLGLTIAGAGVAVLGAIGLGVSLAGGDEANGDNASLQLFPSLGPAMTGAGLRGHF